MAVTADTVPYGGIAVDGMTFTVTGAYVKEWPAYGETVAGSHLVYHVDVAMPDGTLFKGVGWDNLKTSADPTEPSPLVQAEAAMIVRLTEMGATNIVEA